MSICTLSLLLIQEKATLVRLKPFDVKIAVYKPHESGNLLLRVQKKRNHCWLVVSSDYIKVNAWRLYVLKLITVLRLCKRIVLFLERHAKVIGKVPQRI